MNKLLTDRQRRKIQQAINDHHLAFMAEVLGPSAISDEDYKRLKAAGKISGKAPLVTDAATAAHVLGVITNGMAGEDAEKLSAGTFWEMVREQPTALSQNEHAAIGIARERIGEHIKGLGNKLDTATGHIIIDANDKLRRRNLGKVREAVASGVESRETAQQVAQRIRAATGDVKRDWAKIASTEMHNASEEAKAVTMGVHGADPLVYKRVRPDACEFCKLLYMDGVKPRVFRLSDLHANGTNVGRKANRPRVTGANATEYKAVLGAMHPWCQCTLHHLPDGMAFNTVGQLTYVGTKKSLVTVESLDRALLNHECE